MIVKADFLNDVNDLIERTMTYGLSREQANQLCKELCLGESDQIARERRSRLRLVQGGKEGERA